MQVGVLAVDEEGVRAPDLGDELVVHGQLHKSRIDGLEHRAWIRSTLSRAGAILPN